MPRLIAASILLLTSNVTVAEVSERFDRGFVLKYQAHVQSAPSKALRSFGQIERWWDASHSYSGKSRALRLELRPGGCFCERDGGLWVRHLEVVRIEPDSRVVLHGGLGPLQNLAVSGVLVVEAKAEPEGSVLSWSYRVAGDDPKVMEGLATGVDQVMALQFQRLVAYLND